MKLAIVVSSVVAALYVVKSPLDGDMGYYEDSV
jgi:hypothetical protein